MAPGRSGCPASAGLLLRLCLLVASGAVLRTSASAAGAACSSAATCPATLDPVCGSDGRSYANACVARCAGVPSSQPDYCIGDRLRFLPHDAAPQQAGPNWRMAREVQADIPAAVLNRFADEGFVYRGRIALSQLPASEARKAPLAFLVRKAKEAGAVPASAAAGSAAAAPAATAGPAAAAGPAASASAASGDGRAGHSVEPGAEGHVPDSPKALEAKLPEPKGSLDVAVVRVDSAGNLYYKTYTYDPKRFSQLAYPPFDPSATTTIEAKYEGSSSSGQQQGQHKASPAPAGKSAPSGSPSPPSPSPSPSPSPGPKAAGAKSASPAPSPALAAGGNKTSAALPAPGNSSGSSNSSSGGSGVSSNSTSTSAIGGGSSSSKDGTRAAAPPANKAGAPAAPAAPPAAAKAPVSVPASKPVAPRASPSPPAAPRQAPPPAKPSVTQDAAVPLNPEQGSLGATPPAGGKPAAARDASALAGPAAGAAAAAPATAAPAPPALLSNAPLAPAPAFASLPNQGAGGSRLLELLQPPTMLLQRPKPADFLRSSGEGSQAASGDVAARPGSSSSSSTAAGAGSQQAGATKPAPPPPAAKSQQLPPAQQLRQPRQQQPLPQQLQHQPPQQDVVPAAPGTAAAMPAAPAAPAAPSAALVQPPPSPSPAQPPAAAPAAAAEGQQQAEQQQQQQQQPQQQRHKPLPLCDARGEACVDKVLAASPFFGTRTPASLYKDQAWVVGAARISNVRLFYNRTSGCLRGLQLTYGHAAAANASSGSSSSSSSSPAVQLLGSAYTAPNVTVKELRLAPAERIGKAEVWDPKCIRFLRLYTNKGQKVAVGRLESGALATNVTRNRDSGLLLAVRGWQDAPVHRPGTATKPPGKSPGVLKQVQFVWGAPVCSRNCTPAGSMVVESAAVPATAGGARRLAWKPASLEGARLRQVSQQRLQRLRQQRQAAAGAPAAGAGAGSVLEPSSGGGLAGGGLAGRASALLGVLSAAWRAAWGVAEPAVSSGGALALPAVACSDASRGDGAAAGGAWPAWPHDEGAAGAGAGASRALQSMLSVLRPDDRLPCPVKTYPFDAMGQIKARASDGGFVCSGGLIGGNRVLTAGHCVWDDRSTQGPFQDLRFSPGQWKQAGRVSSPYGFVDWDYVTLFEAYVNDPDGDGLAYDVAVITLAKPVGTELGWLGIRADASPCRPAQLELTLAGYPGEDPEHPIPGGWAGGCFYDRCDVSFSCSVSITNHTCDSYVGQSGAPMFDDANYVRAVHTLGVLPGFSTTNGAITIQKFLLDNIMGYFKSSQGYTPGGGGSDGEPAGAASASRFGR